MTIEDETSNGNVVIGETVFEKYRKQILTSHLVQLITQITQNTLQRNWLSPVPSDCYWSK